MALSLSGLTAAQASWSFAGGGNSAVLTITTAASIAPGTYSLQITGTSGATSRSTFVRLLVPDFTITVSPATRSILVGGATTYSVTVGSLGGFGGAVTLAVSGLPAGATATFSRNPVTGAGSAVLTVRTVASTPRGTFTLQVRGTSGARTHQTTVTLTVR